MITNQKIVILTPASLRTNYIEEIKNCGNPIYKKKQFWEFINTDENPELIEVLSASLNLPILCSYSDLISTTIELFSFIFSKNFLGDK